ncbi:MAG: Xylose isomerase protein barrel [Anaerosporomusa subterranea]|jgi:protein FrlC|nr:Xylose isomerase protein barrel [Anaerosporomusa subterranea]
MKISLSTFVYFRYPLIESIKRTALYGYDAVEIWGGRPHAYAEDMSTKKIQEVRSVINQLGIGISCFIPAQFRYPTNLASQDPEIRQKSIDYIKRSIDVAAELGAPFVSLCSGYSTYGQSLDDAWMAMMDSLGTLLEHSAGMPLELVLEPGNRYETDLVVTVDDAIKAVNAFDGRIGILPDTGHLFVNKESLSDVVEKMQGYITHYHIDDNMGITDDHMVPGQGKMSYDIFLQKLKQYQYQGYLAVELGFQYTVDPDIAVKQSADYLRALQNRS